MEPGGLRPLRIGETLDVAIKLYRANFGALVRLVAIVTAPTQILMVFVQASLRNVDSNSFVTTDSFGNTTSVDGGAFAAAAAGFFVISILSFIATEIATAASFRCLGAAYLGEEQTWQESLRAAMKRFRSILWLTIAKDFVIACGFVACIIPGIYFYAAYAVTTPILMLEGLRGRKAMGRSRALVKGRWRPVAGVLFLAYLLTYIINAAFGGLLVGVLFASNEIAGDFARAIGGVIGSALTVPITAAVITVVYLDLRVRKEGFDLELLAESVGVDPTGLSVPSFVAERATSDDDGEQPPFWPPPPGWKPRSQRD